MIYSIIYRTSARPLMWLAFVSLLWVSACRPDDIRIPLENDGTPPAPVTNMNVENMPGGARITYSIPADRDLLKVVAEYEIRPGVKQQAVCSAFDNEVLLQGFGAAGTYTVKVYAVDKSGNQSEAATVTVDPLQPPVWHTYESLDYQPYFGGLLVNFDNASRSNIVIIAIMKDPGTGEWTDVDKNFTRSEGGGYIISGLAPEHAEFGLLVKDNWDNYSDTLFKSLTPLEEQDLNATGSLSFYLLPGDNTSQAAPNWPIEHLLTGPHGTGHGYGNYSNALLPQTITIDLGGKAKISRFRTWPISGNRVYQESNVKDFELWGSSDPNPSGEYDASWTRLGRYTVTKPSGLPYGQVNSVDVATAAAGDEFVMDTGAPDIRYIRIKILSTFTTPEGSAGLVWLTGFNVWGQFIP